MEGWYFSRQQKVGASILMALLSLFIFGWWGWQQTRPEPRVNFAVADSLYEPPIFMALDERVDINLADSAAWTQLRGIGPVLSQRIVRYRNSLGGFDSVAQLSQVYGLRAETFDAILPQLFVNPLTRKKVAQSARKQSPGREIPRLEINQAGAEDFAKLPGIGKVLSRRIVNFREAKGGFSSVEDISRVYRLEAETFQRIRPYLYLKEPEPLARSRGQAREQSAVPPSQRLDLNRATATDLASIPGIGSKLAPRILKYRDLLGHFAAVDQLKSVYGLSTENYERMAPYLQVGELSAYPKKPLNQATAQELAFLPGIDQYQAENLVKAREQQGFFRDWAAVDATPGLSAEGLRQLQFYYRL